MGSADPCSSAEVVRVPWAADRWTWVRCVRVLICCLAAPVGSKLCKFNWYFVVVWNQDTILNTTHNIREQIKESQSLGKGSCIWFEYEHYSVGGGLGQGCSSRPGTRGESLVEEELNHVRDSAWPPGASMLGRSSTSNRDANSRPGTRDGRDGRPVTRDGRPGTREGRAFGESVGEGLGEEIKLSELSGHLAKVYEELCLPETPPNERRASGIMQRLDEDFVFD